MIDFVEIQSGPTAGGAGASAASATTSLDIKGEILAVHLTYTGTHPATTDVTLVTAGINGGAQTLINIANTADGTGWYYPSTSFQDNTGTAKLYAATFEVVAHYAVADKLTLAVAQSDDDVSVEAVVIFRK